ncbi:MULTISPECIES: beta-propeller fold lactonase family protein [Streptomyces]|uniref:Beta-propeller fold lactonase family protein n=1 Tax=Streptomyces doudnae TaxID=3075536 RepID=A0ABD5EL51_9ACTN|nr:MULTISPECIES: beta-propeller fold lactonase family protein [unclassified Streptomyces]MDT0434789.1 beta-propeller fold lactonase family protein [Streptomyces sp. DSM 41981]MYQ68856.1 beta-propeller fold lactonase family protein [Streptomyces sp. SID4950]SCE49542.1 40-residue YVTN family beta-propeller repeat-containing protein [Streptomyces sp. SolWspMP-5a-2]
MHRTFLGRALTAAAALAALSGCGSDTGDRAGAAHGTEAAVPAPARKDADKGLPGMPPVLDPKDLYAADRPGRLSPVVRGFPSRVYVPNTNSNTVTVIDPKTYKVIETIPVGTQPQHVVPSWDLKTLWVNNDKGNTLTPIDPRTGKAGKPVDVHDPYNLYFTPDGKYAVVMASLDRRLVFRDAHTMEVKKSVPVSCYGVNHADFSPDGRTFVVSCEFSGELLKVDTARMEVIGQQKLPFHGAMPQDVKIAPDGSKYYIADMMADGVWILDGKHFGKPAFLRTGKGCHGLYVSRDSREMYISNRGEGTVSVFDFARNKLTKKWHLPGGGSPDMGGVSADGKVLWLTGRYNSEVYALDTRTGRQLARIKVGSGPHGLAVYPQPGRYSLGHTGVFR